MKILTHAIVAFAFLGANLAAAAEQANFTPAAFEAAEKAGKPILVRVMAPWCPTCKAQTPILNELFTEPRFKDLKVFAIDFDSQKDALRRFGVQMQSTLIAFKGSKEVGRSVFDTSKPSIEMLLAESL